MRQHRLYVTDPPRDGTFQLSDKRAHYLRRVLRLKAGHLLTAFDGSGYEWQTRLTSATGAELEITEALGKQPFTALPVALIQCLGRGERMDYAVQKATELGVSAIFPVTSQRTEVRLNAARAQRRHEHWWGVITQACEQSGRAHVPTLGELTDLPDALDHLDHRFDQRLALTPGGAALGDLKKPGNGLAVLIGPEGGLTDSELTAASRHGFTATGFGPRILRTETAGPALLAAAQTLWGDMST